MWESTELEKKEQHEIETGQTAELDLDGDATKTVMSLGSHSSIVYPLHSACCLLTLI